MSGFEPGPITSMWWWPLPAEGELVPDHGPTELSGFVADVTFEDSEFRRAYLDQWVAPDPGETGLCGNCERCTWNPGPDCGNADDPHCPDCGHCLYRHNPNVPGRRTDLG